MTVADLYIQTEYDMVKGMMRDTARVLTEITDRHQGSMLPNLPAEVMLIVLQFLFGEQLEGAESEGTGCIFILSRRWQQSIAEWFWYPGLPTRVGWVQRIATLICLAER